MGKNKINIVLAMQVISDLCKLVPLAKLLHTEAVSKLGRYKWEDVTIQKCGDTSKIVFPKQIICLLESQRNAEGPWSQGK